MNKSLVIWNLIVTALLVGSVSANLLTKQRAPLSYKPGTIRAERLELVDQGGRTRAVLESNPSNASNPELLFYSADGRISTLLRVNAEGYGTLFFDDKKTEGKVSMGYLWGSDSLEAGEIEDPLASWGIRISGKGRSRKSLASFSNEQLGSGPKQ